MPPKSQCSKTKVPSADQEKNQGAKRAAAWMEPKKATFVQDKLGFLTEVRCINSGFIEISVGNGSVGAGTDKML
jgi:hypothetical protein